MIEEVLKKKYKVNSYKELCDKFKEFPIYDLMVNKKFIPGGSILANIGTNLSMSNCYGWQIKEDSIPGIFDTMKEAAETFKKRGGVGLDFSVLRPKGAKVNNAAVSSTGSVSFMPLFSNMVNIIGQSGRRGALLISLDISHPDVIDFIKSKSHPEEVFGKDIFGNQPSDMSGCNISVKISDDFMSAVLSDDNWELIFNNKIYQRVKAKELFELICKQAYTSGDPGILFWDRVIENGLTSYLPEGVPVVTNPCVSYNTEILTKELGWTKIGEVENQKLTIWNGYEWSEITVKCTGHNQEMVEIEFSNGESLKCTLYHKFILIDGTKIEAKDLSVGQKLQKWEFPIIEGSLNIDRKEAYTQGFYCGYGTDAANGTKNIFLYYKKKKLQPYLLHTSSSNYGKKIYLNNGNYKGFNKDFVPNTLWTIQSRLDYLAGLIDSDGSINSKKGSVSIHSMNKDFLIKVKRMINTLGATATIALSKEACIKPMPNQKGGMKKYNCKDCYRLVISAYYVEQLVNLGLYTHRVNIGIANTNRNASRFIYIKSIKKAGIDKKVYCFNEPIKHTGVFNGIMTGQCGEISCAPYQNCLLMSFNVLAYIKDNTFDFSSFKKDIPLVVDFANWVIDNNNHPLELQEKADKFWRKIGIGITGLGDALASIGLKYSSPEARSLASKIMETLTLESMSRSVEYNMPCDALSTEEYRVKYLAQKFMMKVPKDLRNDIKKFGMRNTTFTTIPPCGTISMILGHLTSGCEPLFQREYYRKSRTTGKVHKIIHPPIVEFGIDPNAYETADEIHWKYRIAMQSALQEWTTDSISSTVNLPADTAIEDIYAIYEMAWRSDLKGITIYRDKSKDVQVLNKDNGVCLDRPLDIKYHCAPKRPKVLDCDIHFATAKGEKYVILIGKFNDKPYEVFAGLADALYIPSTCKEGEIIKNGKGKYSLKIKIRGIETEYHDIAASLMNDKERLITRLLSLGLRHGIYPKFIIEQCKKATGSLVDFGAVIARILKKYSNVLDTVEKCPECGGQITAESGCLNCKECGWSKCE